MSRAATNFCDDSSCTKNFTKDERRVYMAPGVANHFLLVLSLFEEAEVYMFKKPKRKLHVIQNKCDTVTQPQVSVSSPIVDNTPNAVSILEPPSMSAVPRPSRLYLILTTCPTRRLGVRTRHFQFLKFGGNIKTWHQAAQMIPLGRVILLHGPHGCGKTAGVHDLTAGHLGRRVFEINPGKLKASMLLREMCVMLPRQRRFSDLV